MTLTEDSQSRINANQFDIPILILAWKRPGKTRVLIDSIRPVNPSHLYIFCDGPRDHRDTALIADTKYTLHSKIDWPASVHTYYSDAHLGCCNGVSSAISWFFSQVPYGIILEDDCIPSPSFFFYCEKLLLKYAEDRRIWCVSGSNFQKGTFKLTASYYFSRYPHCWGWATWSDRWSEYDPDMTAWPLLRNTQLFSTQFSLSAEATYWGRIFDDLHFRSTPDSWAYRWFFTCLVHGGLTTLPERNLVTNIGFDEQATHTTSKSPVKSPRAYDMIFPLKHPSIYMRNIIADEYTYLHHLNPVTPLITRLIRRTRLLLKSYFSSN